MIIYLISKNVGICVFQKKKKREIFIQINNKKNSNIFIYSVLITFPAYTYLIFYLDIFKFRLKFNFIC